MLEMVYEMKTKLCVHIYQGLVFFFLLICDVVQVAIVHIYI
jgi:hypothetical protein